MTFGARLEELLVNILSSTLAKIHMAPENRLLEKEIPIGNHYVAC